MTRFKNLYPDDKALEKVILVAGDVMLDYYWTGSVTRLSPEAPVPVVKVENQQPRLGGAANVAINLASLGSTVILSGVIGNDSAGFLLEEMASRANIDIKLTRGNSRTIEKIRILAQNQQMIRVDFESPFDSEDIKTNEKLIARELEKANYLILSDYKKGVLENSRDLIELAKGMGKQVFVDPKGNDYDKYYGATCITPNKAELAMVVGQWNSEEDLIAKAQALRKNLKIDKILLTRSEEGMTLFEENAVTNFPAEAKEVYDVSGAGDTAIAVLVKKISEGYEWNAAVTFANKAAGIVVGRLGTAALSLNDMKIIEKTCKF